MSELDKTIEDLENEVLADLDEQSKEVVAEKAKVVEGDVEDLGAPVVKGDEKSGPDAAKKVKKDTTIKGKPADQAPQKLKEEDEDESDDSDKEEDDESEEDVVEMEMPKTKAAAMETMITAMKKMSADEAKELCASYMKNSYHTEKKVAKEEVEESTLDARISEIDVQADVAALVKDEDLSEEFTTKASTIFEAAVKSKIRSEVERIESAKVQEVAEEVESFKDELTEKVNTYLDYVVKEWMTENELAIERGLKGEIAEDFISGMKALFEEHYIDVPDEKYDVLEAQASKIDELESKLNETIDKMTDINSKNNALVRESVISAVAFDLADTESEKFNSLVEDVEFTDEQSFKNKLDTLKENYFPKSTPSQSLTEESEGGMDEVDVSGAMAAYMSAIKQSKPYEAEKLPLLKSK